MAVYPKYFERFGFDGTHENMNIWFDAIRRSFKPEKGALKIKYLNNPDFGISGVDSFFVLVERTNVLKQNLKHIIAIDAPETAAHMTVIDTHNIAIVDEYGLRATNCHMPLIANDYTLSARDRAIRVMDVNERNTYEFSVMRHYQVVSTIGGIMFKPLYVCGSIPFGNLSFADYDFDTAVVSARELCVSGYIHTPKFKRYAIVNPRFFILRSTKADFYVVASAMLDKYFGQVINFTGIETSDELLEYQFSKDVVVEIDEDTLSVDKIELPLIFKDFSIKCVVDERAVVHLIERLEQLNEFFTIDQLKSVLSLKKAKDKKKEVKKGELWLDRDESKFREDE